MSDVQTYSSARQIYRVLMMHYVEHMKQSDIATAMNLSTAKVNRLIRQGRDQGMLKISVLTPWQPQLDLENRLRTDCGLKDAVITPTLSEQVEIVLQSVGQAAARYLLENLKDGDTIAISGGRGVSAVIDALKPEREYDITVVPATGGVQGTLYTDVNYVATQMAEKLGGKAFQIHAPLFAETSGQRDMLLDMGPVKDVLDRARRADIAVVGVGSILPDSSSFFDLSTTAKSDRKTIIRDGAVAELLAHLTDVEGRPNTYALNGRIVGLTLDEFHQIPLSIGIAAGPDKAVPVRSVLRGNHIKVLVSDEATTNLVLEHT
jgi:DNA-binding transcriptional regulator LsrR (DeoR family)